MCVVVLGVYAHKKKDTHTRCIRPESTRCCSRKSTKEQRQCFFEHLLLQRFREERGREREREREKRFESSYFILFVVGVLKCVSFTETLLLDLRRRQKKNLFQTTRGRKCIVIINQSHDSLFFLSREESPKRMKKKRGVICLG